MIHGQVMQRMSRTAISNTVVASKDVIFLAGAEAKAAYFTQNLEDSVAVDHSYDRYYAISTWGTNAFYTYCVFF